MQFPGYAMVAGTPRITCAFLGVPGIPCSSKPLAPQPSPVFPTPLSCPVLPRDPRPLRPMFSPCSPVPSPATHLSAFAGIPKTRGQECAPSSSQASRKLLRSAALDLDLLGLSGTRGRPAQHQRPIRAGPACAPSGPPEPHTRVTTTFKGATLQGAPGVGEEIAVALRGGANADSSPWTHPFLLFATLTSLPPPPSRSAGLPVYAMTQARRAISSGSI